MVSESVRKGRPIYLCEICEFGYSDLETAERCEQYCYTHGRRSVAIEKKAVYRPKIELTA
jgi:hypothetical protein